MFCVQINTMTRGRFNASTGEFETIRDPDYHMIWIVHQLIHGVASGDAYTGWQCDVKCQECDEDHGTCQYDGSCECAEGWYGPACDRRCDCYRHVAVKNALELRDQTEDVMLESVESHSGFPIQPVSSVEQSPFRTQTPNYHPITDRTPPPRHPPLSTVRVSATAPVAATRTPTGRNGREKTASRDASRARTVDAGRTASASATSDGRVTSATRRGTYERTVSLTYSNTQLPPNYHPITDRSPHIHVQVR